jgi:hypothetical protein
MGRGMVYPATIVLPRFLTLIAGWLTVLAVAAAAHGAAAPPPPPPPAPDPDTGATSATDTAWVLRDFSPPGRFELIVVNTSSIGYLDQFRWVPPPGTTLTTLTSVKGGTCSITNNTLECTGKIAPPICTCLPGGRITIDFYATGPAPSFGGGMYLQIETMTPVPYHIPSFLTPAQSLALDLPKCKPATKATKTHKATKAQVSTTLHPCTTS